MLFPKRAKPHVMHRLPFMEPPMKLLRQRQPLLNAVLHANTTSIAFFISSVVQLLVLVIRFSGAEFEDQQHVQPRIPSYGAPYGAGAEAVRFGQQPAKPRKANPLA